MPLISNFACCETSHIASMTHSDDAATPADAHYTVGVKPVFVVVQNVTDATQREWYSGMASGSAILTQANGARTTPATGGVVVEGRAISFKVEKDKKYHVLALG